MTAPTSDERREVAARLRSCAQDVNGTRDFAMYLSHWVGFDGVTDDEGKHFTIAADRKEAELTLERLADLIDPTCEMEAAGQPWSKAAWRRSSARNAARPSTTT